MRKNRANVIVLKSALSQSADDSHVLTFKVADNVNPKRNDTIFKPTVHPTKTLLIASNHEMSRCYEMKISTSLPTESY